MLNKGVVDRAIKAGLAFHSDLQYTNIFDRKNIFYLTFRKITRFPTLYHRSVSSGYVEIDQAAPDQDLDEYGMIRDAPALYENDGVNGGVKTTAGLSRSLPGKRSASVFMNQLRGGRRSKLVHDAAGTLIDYNRCGVPLVKSFPNRISEAPTGGRIIWKSSERVLVYMDVSDCKMQEGSMRADINLSVRPESAPANSEHGRR